MANAAGANRSLPDLASLDDVLEFKEIEHDLPIRLGQSDRDAL